MIYLVYFLIFILAVTILFSAFFLMYIVANIFFIIFVTKVPPVQTDRKYFHHIFSQFRIGPETIIYDLGCGGGNFLVEAAKFEPKRCIGYELSLMPYFQAYANALLFGRGRVRILFKDFFKADLKDADLVYVYLVPPLLDRVAQKLKHELRSGTTVIVKGLPLPGIKYVNKITLDDKRNYYAYVYKF